MHSVIPVVEGRLKLLMVALAGALSSPLMCEAETIINRNEAIGTTGYRWYTGDLRIANGATITTSSLGTSGIVSYNNGFVTLTNDGGTIRGNLAGINSPMVSNVSLINNRGVIGGNAYGIVNLGIIGKISNDGLIEGQYGIFNNGGRIDIVQNDGIISSRDRGGNTIHVLAGSIGALVNSGLISSRRNAISVAANGSMQSLHNWGMIAGDIGYETTQELLISGGAGDVFGTLTGASGALGSVDAGWLRAASNVRFMAGNQLLNDHVDVGNHSVINDAANLRIDNHITINGDYRQERAASLVIGVANDARATGVIGASAPGDSGYGQLRVNGNASMAVATSVALVANGSYPFAAGQRFVVMRADSASYNAASLQYSARGFNGVIRGTSVTDGAQQLLLLSLGAGDGGTGNSSCDCGNADTNDARTVMEEADSASPDWINTADNRHAIEALDAVYRYQGIEDDMLDVYNPMMTLITRHPANRGGSQLTPVALVHASGQVARATVAGVFQATAEHIDQARMARMSGISSGESSAQPTVWGKAFGGRIRQGEHDEAAGYHGNFRGMMVGTDARISDNWRVGGLSSYATTIAANEGHNTGNYVNINAYGLTLYGGYDGRPWYVNLIAGIARQQFSTVRTVSFGGFSDRPAGSFSGMQYQASVQAGLPLALTAATRFIAMSGLSYSHLRQAGYTEQGGSAALQIRAAATSSLKGELGGRLEQFVTTTYGDVIGSLQLGLRHEFHAFRLRSEIGFVADESDATSFVTSGVTPIRNTRVAALGVTLVRGKHLTVATSFSLERGQGFVAQTGDIRVRWLY
jgi:outer membrane autotransporter protein